MKDKLRTIVEFQYNATTQSIEYFLQTYDEKFDKVDERRPIGTVKLTPPINDESDSLRERKD